MMSTIRGGYPPRSKAISAESRFPNTAELRSAPASEDFLCTVIPSEALDRTVQGEARNLALSAFKAVRDSCLPAGPRTDTQDPVVAQTPAREGV